MSRGNFLQREDSDMKRTGLTRRHVSQAPSPAFQRTRVPPSHSLIANPELEFHLISIRINELRFPNRKYFAVSARCSGQPARSSLVTCHLSLAAAVLIETPRLEFRATPTKQRSHAKSNRDKTRVLRPPWRNSGFSSASRRAASCAALTLREPPSNLPASCFVRALAGEHS
jgi:hypothetical protein